MTEQEARKLAEEKVWCYMTLGDVNYWFDALNLEYRNPKTGRKKSKPTRSEKELALIEHYRKEWSSQEDAERSVQVQSERFKNLMDFLI